MRKIFDSVAAMYHYSDKDRQLLKEQNAVFESQIARYAKGEIGEDEFKQLRLRNGLYLQRHAYMLRVAIPYGCLSPMQLRTLADVAERFDKGYGHVTTRQNMQFNWVKLEDMPEILNTLANAEMHCIQTSGSCIRNTTTDPLADAAVDEAADPRPWCELVRQWSTLHPEFNWLPRKFKIAVSGASQDRTALPFHDVGLQLVHNDEGELGFRVHVGGGIGRTPTIGLVVSDFVPARYVLLYLEAVLRVYNLYGRRDKLYKSRIKILVKEVGLEEIQADIQREYEDVLSYSSPLSDAVIEEVQQHFPAYQSPHDAQLIEQQPLDLNDADFAFWYQRNTAEHRLQDHRAVYVSLKAPKVPTGDITAEQLRAVAELAEKYSAGDIRSTKDQNLVLPHVHKSHLAELWQALSALNLATPNMGSATNITACPGLDYCNLASATTLDMSLNLGEAINAAGFAADVLDDISINVSGCVNSCSHHHVASIGVLGLEKGEEQFYQVAIGGHAGFESPAIGQKTGRAVAKEDIPGVVVDLIARYSDERQNGETFTQFSQRALWKTRVRRA